MGKSSIVSGYSVIHSSFIFFYSINLSIFILGLIFTLPYIVSHFYRWREIGDITTDGLGFPQGVPPPNDGVPCYNIRRLFLPRGFRPPTTVFLVITSAVYVYLRSIFTAKSSLFILLISLVREIIPGGISI